MMETLLFYTFGAVALIAALAVVAQRRVFYSAVSLIVCLTSLSALYMLLDAPFIAAVQVIVYAGAIMVLFLFVIMLLDPFSASVLQDKRRSLSLFAVLLGAAGLLLLYPLLKAYDITQAPQNPVTSAAGAGSIENIGNTLFNQYLLPFEATSVLILVAIIGAVVLARRQA
jgi:NADH-quinone oxidoreductase subunit J